MADNQNDRRIQRTRQLLVGALMQLVAEKPFNKITVQDILNQANVGRTTFYDHFASKEDLFLSSHERMFGTISRSFFTPEGTLSPVPSADLITFLELSQQSRDTYFYLTGGSEGGEILRLLKDRIAEPVLTNLHEHFCEEDSKVPFSVLAQHVGSSIVAVTNWWLDKRTPYTVQEIATMVHQMNYAALRDALEK